MRSTKSPPPLRVLIAEAHPIVVLGLTDLLHTLGYVLVGSAASGQEAILAAGERQPDLMLVDVDLRGEMDGIAILRLDGDRIAEEWSSWDYHGLANQLGLAESA